MRKILINFAHPAKQHSNVNRALMKAVRDIDQVIINDLYANYPDFMINIKREQSLCESHDVIIFQHPLYWYSTPSIMKEWLDIVLTHGWAYGTTGTSLKGKIFFQALSTGGEANTYQKDGYNKFTLEELTSPYQATANLCHMIWLPPFAITGVHLGLPREKLDSHAENYRRVIMALRDDMLDLDLVKKQPLLNNNVNTAIKEIP